MVRPLVLPRVPQGEAVPVLGDVQVGSFALGGTAVGVHLDVPALSDADSASPLAILRINRSMHAKVKLASGSNPGSYRRDIDELEATQLSDQFFPEIYQGKRGTASESCNLRMIFSISLKESESIHHSHVNSVEDKGLIPLLDLLPQTIIYSEHLV